MTTVDWIIVGLVAALALNGVRQGLLVGALQLAGFAGGAFVGSRLGPLLLADGAHSPYAPLLALGGALLLGMLCATVLELAGAALRRMMLVPGMRAADRVLGAALGGALALGLAWVAGAAALQTPGLELRGDVQRSEILSRLNDVLPPSGSVLNALARFDPLPVLRGPGAEGVAPPVPTVAEDRDVRGASAAVVRVLGDACGLSVEGSGWVAAPGLVVTNAHVVAGQDDTVVQARGVGPRRPARVVHFDATNDVALLRVPGLEAPALAPAGDVGEGRVAAILGFPHNGPYTTRSARVGRTRDVFTEDAYGRGPVRRRVVVFRGVVEPGNSGGPLVDEDGHVLATVFASSVAAGPASGFGVPEPIVSQAVRVAGEEAVGTGPCAA